MKDGFLTRSGDLGIGSPTQLGTTPTAGVDRSSTPPRLGVDSEGRIIVAGLRYDQTRGDAGTPLAKVTVRRR